MTCIEPGILFMRFRPSYSMEDSARWIRQAGFRWVMLWWWDNFLQAGFTSPLPSHGKKEEQLAILKDHDLNVCFIHAHSSISSNELWTASPLGNQFIEELVVTAQDCAQIGVPVMVMHITAGGAPPASNEIGLERINRLAEKAQRLGVTVAIENSRNETHIDYLLNNISSPVLGFCYDSGHDFLYSPKPYEIIRRHGSRLAAVHLHDNEGGYAIRHPGWYPDNHAIPGEGCIDWLKVKQCLDSAGYSGIRLLEVESNTMNHNEKPLEFLMRVKEAFLRYVAPVHPEKLVINELLM